MTLAAMAEHCRRQIALLGSDAVVVFKMPGKWGTGTKRLWRGGPVGQIIADAQERKEVLVMFKAATVLEALQNALSELARA